MEFNNQVVEQFTKMVANIAWYYTEDHTLHKDLMQEGFIGLMKACDKFDESRACFSTYAHMRIRRQMQYYIEYRVKVVHIPVAKRTEVEYGEVYLDSGEYIHEYSTGYCNHEAEERDEIRNLIKEM